LSQKLFLVAAVENHMAKKALQRSTSRASNAGLKLSATDWSSPAGFHAHEIRRATLKEVVDPGVPTKNLPELSISEMHDLAAARLSLVPEHFRVAVMGFGLIDKHRAIAEVRLRSKLGKHLAVLEMYAVQQQISVASRAMVSRKKP
jgi:hypothetical protein